MYKLFFFACILAMAAAAPKPQVILSPYSGAYFAPLAYSAYSAPVAYSAYSAPTAYSAYSAPTAYSAYSAPLTYPDSTFSGYSYSVSSFPYAFYYK